MKGKRLNVFVLYRRDVLNDITLKTTFFDSKGTKTVHPKLKFENFHENNTFSIYYRIEGESKNEGQCILTFLWVTVESLLPVVRKQH
jgi:hypothetical protein